MQISDNAVFSKIFPRTIIHVMWGLGVEANLSMSQKELLTKIKIYFTRNFFCNHIVGQQRCPVTGSGQNDHEKDVDK